MLKTYTLNEAQDSILKRQAFDTFVVPERIMDSLESLFGERVTPEEGVRRILQSIRESGDAAVIEWTDKIDHVKADDLAVPLSEIQAAPDRIDQTVLDALNLAVERVTAFHQQQRDRLVDWQADGLGQRYQAIERIGVYVPGGTAPLPSSLLMSVLPAKVAGVKEIIVCTPPGGGQIPDVILAAAAVCGIDKVFKVGGAQAIGAMAYGTEQIPRVDKIVGPGNLFVTLAKRRVFGTVGVDGLPGPTETMIVADASANPELVAADMLAQAEHDVLASAILVTPSAELAEKVTVAVGKQMESLSRADIIAQSLENTSGIVLVDNLPQGMLVANEYAAEHLCLAVENPAEWVDSVRNAGGVFMGEHSFEVLGDYIAGPSHVMPTGGTARFASALTVLDFLKVINIINLDTPLARELSRSASTLAHAEALTAHAAAAEARTEEA